MINRYRKTCHNSRNIAKFLRFRNRIKYRKIGCLIIRLQLAYSKSKHMEIELQKKLIDEVFELQKSHSANFPSSVEFRASSQALAIFLSFPPGVAQSSDVAPVLL